MRRTALVIAAALALASALAGCGKRERPSALYVLEELEAASGTADSLRRLQRLEIFVHNHPAHPYRSVAYERIFETKIERLKDEAGAMRFVRETLARETDPAVRGSLCLLLFDRLLGVDRTAALALADSLIATERSPRLFMMIGYELMDPALDPERAIASFRRAAELAPGPYGRAQAAAMAGQVLAARGRIEEAREQLLRAAGNPEAEAALAGMLWKEGKREEAFDRYVGCAARMPGARKDLRLDSLYAIARPGASDLAARIMARRIGDLGAFPVETFTDLNGRTHDLAQLRGTKLVIYALSPT